MATVGAQIRVLLAAVTHTANSAGTTTLGGRVYRHRAPENTQWPYVTFRDPVTETSVLRGDGVGLGQERRLQVDLWQQLTPALAGEDHGLPDRVRAALDGRKVVGAHRLRVLQRVRVDDDDLQVLHDAFDIAVARAVTA